MLGESCCKTLALSMSPFVEMCASAAPNGTGIKSVDGDSMHDARNPPGFASGAMLAKLGYSHNKPHIVLSSGSGIVAHDCHALLLACCEAPTLAIAAGCRDLVASFWPRMLTEVCRCMCSVCEDFQDERHWMSHRVCHGVSNRMSQHCAGSL